MKTCRTCGEEKTEAAYYQHDNMASGTLSECKECHTIYWRKLREKRRESLDPYSSDSKRTCRECGEELPPKAFSRNNAYSSGLESDCRACLSKKQAAYKANNVNKTLWSSRKNYAKAQGIPFTIGVEDVVVPTHCPILGIELKLGKGKARNESPTLDRILPKKGYVPGNIAVISHRANRLKSDMTLDEAKRLVAYMAGDLR